jgi:hypothetical protein
MSYDLEGYNTVPERIAEFRTKYPEGRLKQKSLEFIRDFAGKDWVVFTAEAWRTADDPAPAEGTAWEPVPGPTKFTKDSEVQNAETAAWGRAIVAALAADTSKGIASKEEVRNRQEGAPAVDERAREMLVTEWLEVLENSETPAALKEAWESICQNGISTDARLIAKKEARKVTLGVAA